MTRCTGRGAVPIINCNDTACFGENRRWELKQLRRSVQQQVVACIDNDETAAVIAALVHPRYLLIFTSVEG
ncbi:hypothetical protein [Neobittarella massiliensis]|uniref:hypothetical protein n=1 Tax=Neobittarella massiliensis (ex Bilen et al. 2018) TaxID=2041842 RepID=UPI000CF62161|nr:hypothetical protein [Neobittarella massiliensis]